MVYDRDLAIGRITIVLDFIFSDPKFLGSIILALISIFLRNKLAQRNRLHAAKEFQQHGFQSDNEVVFFKKIAWHEYKILNKPQSRIVNVLSLYEGQYGSRLMIVFLFTSGNVLDKWDRKKIKNWIIYVELGDGLPDFYLSTGSNLKREITNMSVDKPLTLAHAPDFSDAFDLSGKQPDRVKQLFDLELIDLIISQPIADIESVNGNLVIECTANLISQDDVREVFNSAKTIADAFDVRRMT